MELFYSLELIGLVSCILVNTSIICLIIYRIFIVYFTLRVVGLCGMFLRTIQ